MTAQARWLRFNLVGLVGFAVQMLTLAALTYLVGVPAVVAVPASVILTVSHNFLWHERVTWASGARATRWRRWISFNLSTGVLSVVTNVVVTPLVFAATGLPLLVANAIAVLTASLLNFVLSDQLIFDGSDGRR